MVRQSSTEVFKVRPIIPIEAIANLGAHVGEKKCLIHGILTPLGIGCRDLVSPVITRAKVIVQFGTELLGDAFIFDKGRVASIAVVGEKGGRCNMFSYPVWIPCSTVEG